MEGYHFNTQKNELESFENGGELEYITGKQNVSNLKAKDNIFLRMSHEEQMVKKSITAIKRRQYRRLVKETIVHYSDLWRELMEDAPGSKKVRHSLVNFYDHSKECDKFWDRHRNYFEDSPHAMFDHGIYSIVIKNEEKEGLRLICKAKEMMVNSLIFQYSPENIKLGLELGKSSNPIAYMVNINGSIIIQDCNLSFASAVMISKTKLKRTNFLKYFPAILKGYYLRIFKSLMATNKSKEVTAFLLKKNYELVNFSMTIKKLMRSEDKKFYAVYLSQNKHI